MQINISHIIKKTTEYFNQRSDVLFAYLFGSYANNTATTHSDIDIAVYLADGKTNSDQKIDILHSLTIALGVEAIGLVILLPVPITLSMRVFGAHNILIDRDQNARHRFESLVMRKYFDFSIIEKEILESRYLNG